MKKMKKFLSVLSAIAVIAAGGLSVSAGDEVIVDTDHIVFSTSDNRFVVDENGTVNDVCVTYDAIAVKMKNESVEKGTYYEQDGYKIKDFSFYKMDYTGGETMIGLDDMELSDDVFIITCTFDNIMESEAVKKLLTNKNVEYIKPIISTTYFPINPSFPNEGTTGTELDELNSKFKEFQSYRYGIDFDKFVRSQFLFYLTFENAEQAESFDINAVEGLEGKVRETQAVNERLYFQFNEGTDILDAADMLNALKNTEAVERIDNFSPVRSWNGSVDVVSLGDDLLSQQVAVHDDTRIIKLNDVVNVAKYIVGAVKFDEEQMKLADYDENGTVDLLDAVKMAKAIVRK